MGSHMVQPPKNCPVNCTFTENFELLPEASAVIFLIPSYAHESMLPEKLPGQYFVGLSMESSEYFPQLNNVDLMKHFDFEMTYRLKSEFPTLYISSKANYSLSPSPKTADALVSIFISNSGALNERSSYVNELMSYIPCHSFGRHGHNKDMPIDASKLDVLKNYKFHLAFENSNTQDYVTEKLFHAFRAGTLPVYMGAPNVDDFCPSNHSIIKVTDFKSPAHLAEYLLFLDKHEEEYNKYFAWKHEGFSDSFKKLLGIVKYDSRCRLCMRLHGITYPKWKP